MPQSTLSATRTDAVLNPTGLVFKLYRDHFGTLPVDVSGNAPPPAPRYPVGGDQPQVNAGSSTYPLDVSASLTPDRSALTIAVINPTTSAQTLALTIRGAAPAAAGARLWQLAPSSVDATIVVGQKPGVVVENVALGALPATLTIPRFSVGIYVLPISTAGSR